MNKQTQQTQPAAPAQREPSLPELYFSYNLENQRSIEAEKTGNAAEQGILDTKAKELERVIMARKPKTARDFAIQFLVGLDNGNYEADDAFIKNAMHLALGA